MNLLLDARRKLQQAHSVQGNIPGQGAEAMEQARVDGENLFAAKIPQNTARLALPNRNLLYALGVTLLLLAAGAAYIWYLQPANGPTPLRPASVRGATTSAPPQIAPPAAPSTPAPTLLASQAAPRAEIAAPVPETAKVASQAATKAPVRAPRPAVPAAPQPDNHAAPATPPVQIGQQAAGQIDPLLADAYQAYRDGRLDEAQRLYLAMLDKDAANPDVLLGLAAIAQQRGEPRLAAQYFNRVLTLDPRNAAANAGMAALNPDDTYDESRLKRLLREQTRSAVLHFALGNLYAAQSRWAEAQQAYFDAYALEPDSAEYAFNLAVSLDHLGQKQQAAQHYRRAMQLDASQRAGFDHAQASSRAHTLEQ